MELISHIYANATFSRELKTISLENLASIKRIFRIVKERHGLIGRATQTLLLASNGAGAGGANRDRTGDLLLAKQALSQLSYGPSLKPGGSGRSCTPDLTLIRGAL